jgi:hypothetical protein
MYRDPLPDRSWQSLAPAGPSQVQPRRRRLLARVLREPLTHFVAIGIAIFVAAHVIEEQRSRYNIAVSSAAVVRIANTYAQQYGAPPTPQQMRTMIDNQVREEIYLREGLALGLDRDDEIVRRRIAQKFDFLQQDQAAPREPSEAQLRAWYEGHKDRFTEPARRSFEQRFYAPDQRGDAAAKALATGAANGLGSGQAAPSGDSFPGPGTVVALAADEVERVFGGIGFGAAVFAAPVGKWSQPLRSGFGWHVIRVTEARPAHARNFDEARADVRRDWIEADRQKRNDAVWETLRARYAVTLPGAR